MINCGGYGILVKKEREGGIRTPFSRPSLITELYLEY